MAALLAVCWAAQLAETKAGNSADPLVVLTGPHSAARMAACWAVSSAGSTVANSAGELAERWVVQKAVLMAVRRAAA